MIRINLALRKQSSSVTGNARSSAAVSTEALQDPQVKLAGAFVVAAIALTYAADFYKEDELKAIDTRIEKYTAEQTKLKADLDKTKSYEKEKAELDANALLLRTQIDVIEKLLADRQSAPKFILGLSTVVPQDVWLRSLTVKGPEVSIIGSSKNFNSVTDLMHNLTDSPYLNGIQLKTSQQELDPLSRQLVATFDLAAKRR